MVGLGIGVAPGPTIPGVSNGANTMGLMLHVDDAQDLHLVTAALHDDLLDLDTLVYDVANGVVTVAVWRQQNRGTGAVWLPVKDGDQRHSERALVTVEHVWRCDVSDTQRVGRYDIDRFEYDGSGKKLTIRTGIPLSLRLLVNDLSVSVASQRRVLSP
jgi:hypothetical protein